MKEIEKRNSSTVNESQSNVALEGTSGPDGPGISVAVLEEVDRKIHHAIELDQVLLLTSDLAKGKIHQLFEIKYEQTTVKQRLTEIDELLETLASSCEQNANLLHEVKRLLRERRPFLSNS
jgi:hypothetical protein